jgi:hypothetical protein
MRCSGLKEDDGLVTVLPSGVRLGTDIEHGM